MRVTFRHEIDATPEAVYSFFEHISENCMKWHPDHLGFRWIERDGLSEGAVASLEHRVQGKVLKLADNVRSAGLAVLSERTAPEEQK